MPRKRHRRILRACSCFAVEPASSHGSLSSSTTKTGEKVFFKCRTAFLKGSLLKAREALLREGPATAALPLLLYQFSLLLRLCHSIPSMKSGFQHAPNGKSRRYCISVFAPRKNLEKALADKLLLIWLSVKDSFVWRHRVRSRVHL